ncbi:luxQ, periplasmic family protein, partial [Vibrio parahaemolyticus V-223/04]
CWTA